MITSTTDEELKGDNQDTPLESFSKCKYDKPGETEYVGVTNSCRFKDCYGNCVLERCYFEQDESPNTAHKHWIKCATCGDYFSLPPNQVMMPICPKCQSILFQHLHYPQTCCKCGSSIAEPTSMPFTRLCNECISKYLFSDACVHFELGEEVSTIPLDLP